VRPWAQCALCPWVVCCVERGGAWLNSIPLLIRQSQPTTTWNWNLSDLLSPSFTQLMTRHHHAHASSAVLPE
jgi:hypothetical protein